MIAYILSIYPLYIYTYYPIRFHYHLHFLHEACWILVPYLTCAIVCHIWSACCNHLTCDLENISKMFPWKALILGQLLFFWGWIKFTYFDEQCRYIFFYTVVWWNTVYHLNGIDDVLHTFHHTDLQSHMYVCQYYCQFIILLSLWKWLPSISHNENILSTMESHFIVLLTIHTGSLL